MPLYLLLEVIKGNSVSPPRAAFPKQGSTWEWLGEGSVDRPQYVLQSLSFHSCLNDFLKFFCLFLKVYVHNPGNPDTVTSA